MRERTPSGVPGLDGVLGGGWPTGRMYMVEGRPGTGKTTLGLQFLLHGAARGESLLYITLSETREEVLAVAASHGWSLDGVTIFDLDAAERFLGLGDEQTMFDPSDVEFRATTAAVQEEVDRVAPSRVVFDSLSELALLGRDALAFRREILSLKRTLIGRSTTLLMSDQTDPSSDRHLHSLAHGVLQLQVEARDYGPERRRLRVVKLRGGEYRGGYHDFDLARGGITVHPRLVAAEHGQSFSDAALASGLGPLDALLGGGLARGASTLFLGPAGTGKSSMVSLFAFAAVEQGEPAAIFLFDEERESFLGRALALGHDLRPHVESGRLSLEQLDPASISPGTFIHRVRQAVETHGVRFLGIDSINGYLYALPEERDLALQLHELLSYLAKLGVATALVLTQAGLIGFMEAPADLTYVADGVVLTRFFEADGEVRRAVSVLKKRSGHHEAAIRELSFGPGLVVGESLTGFRGVLSGSPTFVGDKANLIEPRTPEGD